jgi:hypothetical protein
VARLTIVADPDQLLTEQGVVAAIRARGFDLIPFEDHVAFRYAYESRYRQRWDRGEETNLVVVLRVPRRDVSDLPYDLLQEARRNERLLSFSIAELFPNLVPGVVAELDRADLDALYRAQALHEPGPLGENATCDFILRHVFDAAPELIKTEADLLRVLLRRHYRGRRFPDVLDRRFIHLLRKTGRFRNWPLGTIVSDRSAFLDFLQKHWERFLVLRYGRRSKLRNPKSTQGVAEAGGDYRARTADGRPWTLDFGPSTELPFDHDDVRVYIDNLFVEGHLARASAVPKELVRGTWMEVGVAGETASDDADRFKRLTDRLEREHPGTDATYSAWLDFAQLFAEWLALRWKIDFEPSTLELGRGREAPALHDRIESVFTDWMLQHYATLFSLSYWPRPVMLHHVPRFLAHGFAPGRRTPRIALLVVDGLALDQWVVLRDHLAQETALQFDESAVFAWVPTLTAVSRQAIFAGDPPFYFGTSIKTTYKEEQHWRRFWEHRGARRSEVAYLCQKKQEPDSTFVARVRETIERPGVRIVAVVVGTLDQTMHGMVLGSSGMHAQVKHWAAQGGLRELLEELLGGGFEVTLTADHGNIEGHGMGKPNVGAVADERGERAHVFPDERTRKQVHEQYPGSIAWPPVGLPEHYLPLLAPGRRAFLSPGKRTVCHGGIALEEVVVPFVRVSGPVGAVSKVQGRRSKVRGPRSKNGEAS